MSALAPGHAHTARQPVPPPAPAAGPLRIALLGNPNTGKTTLFNALTGLRHKTSNFPGTTLEARTGRASRGQGQRTGGPVPIELVDLPGIYSLELDQLEARLCREVLAGLVAPRGERPGAPDAVCVVLDATNLARNLMFAGEVFRRRLPTVVAVNMTDLARRRGIHLQPEALAEALGCEAVLVSARTGEGLSELAAALTRARIPLTPPGDEPGLSAWAERAFVAAASAPTGTGDGADTFTDRLDRAFTHPVLGTLVFVAVMTGLFWTLYTLARFPMDWIELIFTALTGLVTDVVPAGAVRDLLANGVVAGVGATVIFLPQVCLLFFLISLLEDTGYLARAAFVMDRVLRPFGLPGHSFVPLLSSHACALPGIMACRSIPDRRQRLATILVAPFMTCSARLPVYVLLIGILLGERPALAAIAFVGCYALGIAAGVGSAMIARRTILRGAARPMALELPTYKRPSFRTALLTTLDRARMFLRKAGTAILAICIVLWWLSAYPRVAPPAEAVRLREEAVRAEATWPADLSTGTPARAGEEGDRPGRAPLPPDEARALADELEARHAQRHSFAGRLGRAVQPVFEPLGYDWQLTIGLLTSLAAREVFVSTMSVVLAGTDDAEDQTIKQRIVTARRDDGVTPVFTPAASWSLLVYYVLAMQCLPTLAVTAREAGGVRWALLQLAWMTGLAYLAALVTFQVLA